jgi:hypothetical protein
MYRNLFDGLGLAISSLVGAFVGFAFVPAMLLRTTVLDLAILVLLPCLGAVLGGIAWKADGWVRGWRGG